ncbi:MAG: hypothetical protein NTX82_05540 [Candidatus Parcubacteria bacterium]|nr:hypothetical protein [Candidatus Parcubacteria bacterium]
MKKYDTLVVEIDGEGDSFGQFFERMATGEPIYLTPVYTHYKEDDEPTDEFLIEQRVQIIISSIVANKDCTLSITFKLADAHEAIICGEHTLVFNHVLICDEIPDNMYDPEFLAAQPPEKHQTL